MEGTAEFVEWKEKAEKSLQSIYLHNLPGFSFKCYEVL